MTQERVEGQIHVLGIESSCDDTGVAVVDNNGNVLSNCIHSQLKQHLAHGGIIPVVAKEYHIVNIDRVARQAVEQSGLKSVVTDVDAIAVSTRPGLKFSLQVGLNYARTLAKKYSKPLIPIHHMQAHALMPLLENPTIKFPFIALLISGGHCLLSIAKRYNEFHLLGSSRDDAPGDLLDKVGRRCRLRNLGAPFDRISGGASIELLSQRPGANRFKYFHDDKAIPMLSHPNCDFSFSGYRGNLELLYPMIDELWQKGDQDKLLAELSDICASLQRVILVQLAKKLQRAFMFYRMHWRYENEDAFSNIGSASDHLGFELQEIGEGQVDLVVSGGVAANSYLIGGIRQLCKEELDPKMKVFAPSKALCSDNGLMVAWNGMLRYRDFLLNGKCYSGTSLDYSVVHDPNQLDLIDAQPDVPMGLDVSHKVVAANFRMAKFNNTEFKVVKKQQCQRIE